jgi:hypothetical protein
MLGSGSALLNGSMLKMSLHCFKYLKPWNVTHACVVEPTKWKELIGVEARQQQNEPVEGDGLAEGLVGGAARLVEAELDAGLVGPRAACTTRTVVALSLDSFFNKQNKTKQNAERAHAPAALSFSGKVRTSLSWLTYSVYLVWVQSTPVSQYSV